MASAAHFRALWTAPRLKLLLTLLAIITGFAGGDAVRAAPAAPSAFGAALALAEAVSEGRAACQIHRPLVVAPQRYVRDRAAAPRAVTAAPRQLDIPSFGLRTRE